MYQIDYLSLPYFPTCAALNDCFGAISAQEVVEPKDASKKHDFWSLVGPKRQRNKDCLPEQVLRKTFWRRENSKKSLLTDVLLTLPSSLQMTLTTWSIKSYLASNFHVLYLSKAKHPIGLGFDTSTETRRLSSFQSTLSMPMKRFWWLSSMANI